MLLFVLGVAFGLRRPGENLVDQAVLDRLARGEEAVAVGVLGDDLDRLTRVLREDFVELLAGLQNVLGLNFDVRDLPPTSPYGWWIIILEWGRQKRFFADPPATRIAPPLAARPTQ